MLFSILNFITCYIVKIIKLNMLFWSFFKKKIKNKCHWQLHMLLLRGCWEDILQRKIMKHIYIYICVCVCVCVCVYALWIYDSNGNCLLNILKYLNLIGLNKTRVGGWAKPTPYPRNAPHSSLAGPHQQVEVLSSMHAWEWTSRIWNLNDVLLLLSLTI